MQQDALVAAARHGRDPALAQAVSHGNAVGVYFRDPEGNRLEVYCATGLRARQPYLERVDLTRSPEAIMHDIIESVRLHGATGFVDRSALEKQDIGASR